MPGGARIDARLAAGAILGAACLLYGCASGPQRDGPPARVPDDLAARPDAQPRVEPFHPYANRPYVVLGRRYVPLSDDVPFRQRGLASWYGRQFHGNRTASGEVYDMFAMTAAHPTLPLPSYARVTHLASGASVVVRINDRGPFTAGRVIDLSYAAAVKLGVAATGTAEVEVRRLTFAEISGAAAAEPAPVASAAPARGWAVQLGAFTGEANAQALHERTRALLAAPAAAELEAVAGTLRIERDGGWFRVLLGAAADRAGAALLALRLEELLGADTTIVLR
jgi:rare lipoprotein A